MLLQRWVISKKHHPIPNDINRHLSEHQLTQCNQTQRLQNKRGKQRGGAAPPANRTVDPRGTGERKLRWTIPAAIAVASDAA